MFGVIRMNKVEFGDICISGESAPLVIPEIGINHNGSLEEAKKIVYAAYRAGAKLIKHQTHVVDDEMVEAEARKVVPGNAKDSIYEIMARAALSEADELALKRYTESLGMFFLSTPFSRAAADRLRKFNVGAYKIGSGELNNYPLLDYVASFGKPMIVSTGMNDMVTVSKAVNILRRHRVAFVLLHTTNIYPTKPEFVRLGAMQQIMGAYPDIPVGLSDHTVNNNACIAAMALGAKVVERHFTDTMDRLGPDIVCSMDETALGELIQASVDINKMLGGQKEELPEEKPTSDFAFASVVAIENIQFGEQFSHANLWVKRPGTGEVLAVRYWDVLGRLAKRDIKKGEQLTNNDF